MCVGSPTAGTLSNSQSQPDDEFEMEQRQLEEEERRWLRLTEAVGKALRFA